MDKTTPASVKLHTMYRDGHAPVATITKWNPRTFNKSHPYQLTTIHDHVAESASWFASEQGALDAANSLGYATADATADATAVALDPLPPWLGEIVLSMEHDHSPAVRSYGDLLRRHIQGK